MKITTLISIILLSSIFSCIYGQTVYSLDTTSITTMNWNSMKSQIVNVNGAFYLIHQINSVQYGAVSVLVSNETNYFYLASVDSNSGNVKEIVGLQSLANLDTPQFSNVFYDSNHNTANLLFDGSDNSNPDSIPDLAYVVFNFTSQQINTYWLGQINFFSGSYDESNQLYYVANIEMGSYSVSAYNTNGVVVQKSTIYASNVNADTLYLVLACNGNLFSFVNIGIQVQVYYLDLNNNSQQLLTTIITGFWQAINAFNAYFDKSTSTVFFSVYSDSQSSVFQLSFSDMSTNSVYSETAILLTPQDLIYVN